MRFWAAARAAAGVDSAAVDGGTLAEVLAAAVAAHGDLAALLPRCSYLLDGVAVRASPASTRIAAGSVVEVLPPFAGG